MFNKKRIKKLVEALRSGDYNQTMSNLRDLKGHCCLGVACDISGKGGWSKSGKGDWSKDPIESLKPIYLYEGYSSVMPPEVRNYYDFLDGDPGVFIFKHNGEPSEKIVSMSELNDHYEYNFETIACILESNFLIEDSPLYKKQRQRYRRYK
jgi:hypothetical protein